MGSYVFFLGFLWNFYRILWDLPTGKAVSLGYIRFIHGLIYGFSMFLHSFYMGYPLVDIYITDGKVQFKGKTHDFDWAMFNS